MYTVLCIAFAMASPSHILGIAEIAELSGVSKQAVSNWRKRYPDFPQPFQELSSGPLFQKSQVMTWFLNRKYDLWNEGNVDPAKMDHEANLFFQSYHVKTGEFDRYYRVKSIHVSINDRVKLTVKDEFGAHQIYEATVVSQWGGNFIVSIDKTYSPELAWEDDGFPKVGESFFIEPSMISVGLKRNGVQYGGLPENSSTDDEILKVSLFSPRWGHNDVYKINFEENEFSFFRTRVKVAKCKWTYETGWVWGKKTVEEILANNGVYPPRNFVKMLTYIAEAIRLEELNFSSAQEILDEISEWINHSTHNRPKHTFWQGVF